jgi:lipoprotein-anchoring transpeptidase ErfK/SrfK
MFLRVASGVAVLTCGLAIGLMTDLGVPGGQALAQYYPPQPVQPYPPQSYPAPYPQQSYGRPLPPPIDQDDDLDALGPPRTFGLPGGRPPPPQQQPGVQYGGRAVYPQEADPYAVPPPAGGYPNGASQPGYGGGPYGGAPYGGAPYPGQEDALRPPMSIGPGSVPGGDRSMSALPPDYQPETAPAQLPPQFRRTQVDLRTKEPAGTIIIDTPHTYLYLVLGNGKAIRYGIGVGREGFTWAGTERISRMAEWPDWHPPSEMIDRQPYLPRFMAGGESNPLGARALYLGKTLYRIHGTNQPSTIGSFVSSGCIRLTNEDISDLYGRVQVGTRVVVMPGTPPDTAQATPIPPAVQSSPLAPPGVRTR